MGRRGPRPKGSRTSTLREASGPKLVDSKEEEARLQSARKRVPGRPAKAFFDAVTAEFAGWSAPELELLVRAGQAFARIEEARELVKEEGVVVTGAKGAKVRNPALLIERQALADLRATLKQLRLEEAGSW